MKRYNLEMPDELWQKIDRIATRRNVSAAALIRAMLSFGVETFEKDYDVIIRDGRREREVKIVLS